MLRNAIGLARAMFKSPVVRDIAQEYAENEFSERTGIKMPNTKPSVGGVIGKALHGYMKIQTAEPTKKFPHTMRMIPPNSSALTEAQRQMWDAYTMNYAHRLNHHLGNRGLIFQRAAGPTLYGDATTLKFDRDPAQQLKPDEIQTER